LRLRTYALSATVPFGPSNLIAEWAHTNQDRAGLARISRGTGAVGYDHLLSKRSDVYAVLLHDKVTNLHGGTGVAAGLRHRF
jgi:predicted porin